MRIWEIAGWLLLVIGLFVFYQCFALLVHEQPRIIETGPLTVIGVVVFRGGIHLLKIGAAVQACRQQPPAEPRNTPPRPRGRDTTFSTRTQIS